MSAAPSLSTGPGPREASVFLSDFLHIDAALTALRPTLLDAAAPWLHLLRAAAGEDGAATRPRAAVVLVGPVRQMRHPFLICAGEPRERDDGSIAVPIRLEPAPLNRFLPTLDADLELSALDENAARLGINARYKVPLARIGLEIDKVALHRVAESSVRNFLQDLADALLASAG
jgi:hypothetical protein